MLILLLWRWIDPDVIHTTTTNWAPALASVSTESPLPDASAWSQLGPAGVVAGFLASIAWYFIRTQQTTHQETLRIERERSARFEQEIRDLNKQFRDQVVPVLTQFTGEATRLTQATTEAIQTMTRARDR